MFSFSEANQSKNCKLISFCSQEITTSLLEKNFMMRGCPNTAICSSQNTAICTFLQMQKGFDKKYFLVTFQKNGCQIHSQKHTHMRAWAHIHTNTYMHACVCVCLWACVCMT